MISLVIGGARSGKSNFAENYFKGSSICYIATAFITDDEMKARVQKHINDRPKEWRTCENLTNPIKCLGEEDNYILDDVTNLISNIMYEKTKELVDISDEIANEIELIAKDRLNDLFQKIDKENKNLILVSNEVGSSIVPSNRLSRVFRDINGRVNQYISKRADSVFMMVAGIEVKIK